MIKKKLHYIIRLIFSPTYTGGGQIDTSIVFCEKVFKYFPYTMTKSIFRPTSSHWISIFYSSLESLRPKQAECTIFATKFCTNFVQTPLQEIRTFIVLLKVWRHFCFYLIFALSKTFSRWIIQTDRIKNSIWDKCTFLKQQKKLKKDWNPFLNWKYILLVFLWKC